MNLTRRELLRRMAILAASLPASRLLKLPSDDDTDDAKATQSESEDIQLYESGIDMYCVYPEVITGWTCKEYQNITAYWNRICDSCEAVETAIPETWTCPSCDKMQAWEERCTCYRSAYSVKSKINPFWIG